MTSSSAAPISPFVVRNLVALAILIAIQAACGGNDSTGPTTTTGTTGTTSTTGTPTTTTGTPTSTTGTTTTGGGGGGSTAATATFNVTNTPCVAPSNNNVSCTFNAAATGATAPYKFDWKFTNPANNQILEIRDSASVRPELGCSYSSGVVTFTINVSVTATPASGTAGTVTGTQSITRAAGACGT